MSVNQLGALEFVRFTQPFPVRPKQNFAIEVRPGRDGFAAIAQGSWGRPFNIDSLSVFDTFANAMAAANSYQNSLSLIPVDVIYEGTALYVAYGVKYMILDCEIVEIKSIPLMQIGGTVTTPANIVVARWSLLPKVV